MQIVFVGQGGQGILLAGNVFAEAVFLAGKEVAQVPTYGSATRGEPSSSEVVISDEEINFPGVMTADILVALSQESYNLWLTKISANTQIFFDENTVKLIVPDRAQHISIPAIKTAGKVGSRQAANMVMLGALIGVTEIVPLSNLFDVIEKATGKYSKVNLDAVREGYKLGKQYLMDIEQKATK